MAEVLHGNASANQLNATTDKTQVYGLAGNDTLTSDGKSGVLLVGGSGSDSLIMSGGNGTLSGGTGADTFELNYSATQTISAVIEDVEPASDKIVVNFDGTATPTLNSVASGNDVVLSDSTGNLNVTLKGVRENDYFDGTASDEAWEVLKLTNDEREAQGLSQFTASEGLTAGASVRAQEITESFSHTRPDGTSCFTVLEKSYYATAENIAGGQNSPASVVTGWMNSTGHRANILNSDYQKLGVGYVYEDSSDYEHYWVQLFGSTLTTPETVSTVNLLTTPVEVNNVSKVIQLANGGATYSNTVEGATIIGGTGNDTIDNGWYNSTRGSNVSINGAAGNDSIDNHGSNVTINGGTGHDDIDSSGLNVLIYGGDDDDNIYSYSSSNATIDGGSGEDSIRCAGSNVSIDGGVGNDTISSGSEGAENITVNGGNGDDYIYNSGSGSRDRDLVKNILIAGGNGNDTISNSDSKDSTITGGDGDDFIGVYDNSANNLIQYASGDGNDTVSGLDSTSTLQIGGGTGTYSTQVSGSDVIVSVGTGSILLTGAASLGSSLNIAGTDNTDTTPPDTTPANPLLITLTEGDDTYSNSIASATIAALGGNDSIDNFAANVSISGGLGADSIYNGTVIYDADGTPTAIGGGEYSSIYGGMGDDYLYNRGTSVIISGNSGNDSINNIGSSVTIDAGDGNDIIFNTGWGYSSISSHDSATFAKINAGAGNDSVYNSSSNVSIDGATGNDSIDNAGDNSTINASTGDDRIIISTPVANTFIQYSSGDGNDTISGIKSSDTLQIGGGTGTYSTQTSGSDIIVSVGTGSILLQGAASLGSSLNIAGTDSTDTTPANPLLITLTEGDDTYTNTLEGATIAALGGNDSIYNSRDYASVSIDGGNGDDTLNTYGIYVTVDGGKGNDSIYNDGGGVIVRGGDGNDSIYNDTHNTINGSFGYVTIDAGAGNDTIDNNDPLVSIIGGAGNDLISIHGSSWYENTISGGTGNDQINLSNSSNLINYTSGEGDDIIYGFSLTSTLEIGGGTGTYSTQVSGDDVIVTVGDGKITLQGAATLSVIHINDYEATHSPASKFITLTENPDNYTNTVEGATIQALGGKDTLWNDYGNVSIIGGRDNDEIRLSGSGTNSTLKYEPGDGNDTVWGNDTNTTLQIVADTVSSIKTGNDIIYYIGDGSIRLVGARIRPPHVVLGASGTSGGTSSGSSGGTSSSGGGNSASGNGSSGGNGGGSGNSSGSSGNGNGFGGNVGSLGNKSAIGSSGRSSRGSTVSNSSNVGRIRVSRPIIDTTNETRNTNLNFMTTSTQQTVATDNRIIYTGGDQVVPNYTADRKIFFLTEYVGSFYDGAGNYFAGSTTGALVLQNATEKVIDLNDAAGNVFVKAYAATNAGVIDGRGLAGFEMINGSAGSDAIFAGDGGSQLWGGLDVAADVLVGGGGTDIFIGGRTQGADVIANASSTDIVHLNDATLSDIVATAENNGAIAIAFNTGNVVGVQSSEALSATFMLADGSAYRYNHANKSWQSA